MVWAIAIFFSGIVVRIIPNATGNIAIPTPCNTLANNIISIFVANLPTRTPTMYIGIITSRIFFWPWISESLPAIGVITAAAMIYAESIHDEALYEIPNSSTKSGIAGIIMVSSNMTIIPTQLKMMIVFHADVGILSDTETSSGFVIFHINSFLYYTDPGSFVDFEIFCLGFLRYV